MDDDTDETGGSNSTDNPESTDARVTTVRHDWKESERPSMAIVKAVAAATGRKMTVLPPLQETIETDALDTLLTGQSSSIVVSFRYADTGVSVKGGGSIDVRIDGHLGEEDDR